MHILILKCNIYIKSQYELVTVKVLKKMLLLITIFIVTKCEIICCSFILIVHVTLFIFKGEKDFITVFYFLFNFMVYLLKKSFNKIHFT